MCSLPPPPPPPAGTQFLRHISTIRMCSFASFLLRSVCCEALPLLSPVLRQHTLNHSQMEPDDTTMFTPGMSVMFIRSIGHVLWGRSLHIQSMVMHIATSLMSVKASGDRGEDSKVRWIVNSVSAAISVSQSVLQWFPPSPLSKQRLCPSNTRHWFRQFLHR